MSESVSSHVDAKYASNILLKLKTRLQDKVIETTDLKSEENSQILSSDNQNENAVDKVESKGDDDNVRTTYVTVPSCSYNTVIFITNC
jgi:hypothetical protein